ncbi:hypothetical protein ANN_07978 [Periplaneta americana]|uniref:Uncharacterized protein n=1 Tax=Periplaneta americana TaxID=6978 RepID=A0ABQ8T1P6_PERAM|nr:hypothetical protein ANN_07978 [Periplaneta americana]
MNEHRFQFEAKSIQSNECQRRSPQPAMNVIKRPVAQHSIEKEHKILFDHTKVINKSSHYWDRTIKEAIEIKLEKNNFNRDSGLQLSQAWTPALDQTIKVMKITDRGRQPIPTGGTGLAARQTSRRNPGRGAMEALLKLTPLDAIVMEEAKIALYRLQHSKQLIFSDVESGLLEFKRVMADDILCMEAEHINPVKVKHIVAITIEMAAKRMVTEKVWKEQVRVRKEKQAAKKWEPRFGYLLKELQEVREQVKAVVPSEEVVEKRITVTLPENRVPLPLQTSQMIGWRSTQQQFNFEVLFGSDYRRRVPRMDFMCLCCAGTPCVCK